MKIKILLWKGKIYSVLSYRYSVRVYFYLKDKNVWQKAVRPLDILRHGEEITDRFKFTFYKTEKYYLAFCEQLLLSIEINYQYQRLTVFNNFDIDFYSHLLIDEIEMINIIN